MTDKTIVRRFTDTKVIVRQSDTPAKVIIRNLGPKGDDGDSAYAVAVANGFVGTVEEWLDSLVGADGSGGSGSRVLYGDGVPDPSLGVQSDSYVDRLTGKFYRKWSKPASWPWTPEESEDPDLAADVKVLAPGWEGSGSTVKELVSGRLMAMPASVTWAVQNGIPVVRFAGTGDGLRLAQAVIGTSTTWTAVVVLRVPSTTPNNMSMYGEFGAGGTNESYCEAVSLGGNGAGVVKLVTDTYAAATDPDELFVSTENEAPFDLTGFRVVIIRRDGATVTVMFGGDIQEVNYDPGDNVVVTSLTQATIGVMSPDGVTFNQSRYIGDLALPAMIFDTARSDAEMVRLAINPFGPARQAGADLTLESGYWVLEAELATQAELDALTQTVADFPLPRPLFAQPLQWNWSKDNVHPKWAPHLAKLKFCAAFLTPGEAPYDLVSGLQAEPRGIGLTPSVTVKDGLLCQDGASGGHWHWPTITGIDQPVSAGHVFQGTSFIKLPYLRAELFGANVNTGISAITFFQYAIPPSESPTQNAISFLEGEPTHGPGWHAVVNGVVSRGVPAPHAIDGRAPLTGDPVVLDDGLNPSWVTLAGMTDTALCIGLVDSPGITVPGSYGAMEALFSPPLTKEEAEQWSADPFGMLWPIVPAGGTTGQVLTKATGDDYDAGWDDPAVTQVELDAEATARGNADTALDGRLDVVEPLTPSLGEKAALVGTSGTPGSGNKYVTDGDTRNTNARTPTAHTHPESEVTNLVTDLAEKIPTTEKGAASGVATLDGGGKVPSAQLPAVALVKPTVVADLAARLALTAEAGDVAVQTDTTKTYMLKEAGDPTVDADWIELKAPSGGAPAGSPYVTFGTDATLSNERVVTDTPTVAWDIGTAGQIKASVPDDAITTAKILAAALKAIGALTPAADKYPYFTGSGAAALGDLSAFIRTLLDDANQAAAQATLGLVPGTNVGIAPDVQAFTASGTWTKPAGAKSVYVVCIGSGGGGGSGRRGAAVSVRCGGGGGGGCGLSWQTLPASILGATETVTVGVGGTGGAARTADNTDGAAGGNGGQTSFGAWLRAPLSTGGAGGTATAGAGGAGQGLNTAGVGGGAASVTGGVGATASGNTLQGAGGGGAGGGITALDAPSNGGVGGGGGGTRTTALTGGTAGTAGGGGGTGTSATASEPVGGGGGGGGAASIVAAAGAGGNAGIHGAGGGGGGASLNGNNSGAGGNGAGGLCLVISL